MMAQSQQQRTDYHLLDVNPSADLRANRIYLLSKVFLQVVSSLRASSPIPQMESLHAS